MTDEHLERIDEENEEDTPAVPETTSTEGATEEGDVTIQHGSEKEQPEVPLQQEVKTTPQAQRMCFVCSQVLRNNVRCLQPCPCGFWVHHSCLVSGVQKYEASHPGCSPLGCKYCFTRYNIYPKKNLVVQVFEAVNVRYGQFCEFGGFVMTVFMLESTFTALGLVTLSKIYGREEAVEMLISMEPAKAAAICKCIPLTAVAVNYIPWENGILRGLRRCARLPVVGGVFPSADPRVREVKRRRTFFGVVMGGILLPWHANWFGVTLFSAVQSRLHRFLVGGAAFLVLKGVFQMYYRQKLYARQCCLTVEARNDEE